MFSEKFVKPKIHSPEKPIILMPKNTINITSEIMRIYSVNYNKLKTIKIKYKDLYKKITNSNQKNYNNIKTFQSNNNIEPVNIGKRNLRKNKSFLNRNDILLKDNNILLELDKLKLRIKLKHKKNTYSSYKKNILFNDNKPNNNNKNINIHSIINYDKKNILLKSENMKKKNNVVISYQINKKNLNKKQSNDNIFSTKNESIKTPQKNRNNNEEQKILSYNQKNNYINDIEKSDKRELIKENEKLKKELEYSNNQLKKYKKYQELYLNLLKKVKNNKNLIKNINLNNEEKDSKDSEDNKVNEDGDNKDNNIYYNDYVNELIDRGSEIKRMLKEDEILEKNIKNLLSTLE